MIRSRKTLELERQVNIQYGQGRTDSKNTGQLARITEAEGRYMAKCSTCPKLLRIHLREKNPNGYVLILNLLN